MAAAEPRGDALPSGCAALLRSARLPGKPLFSSPSKSHRGARLGEGSRAGSGGGREVFLLGRPSQLGASVGRERWERQRDRRCSPVPGITSASSAPLVLRTESKRIKLPFALRRGKPRFGALSLRNQPGVCRPDGKGTPIVGPPRAHRSRHGALPASRSDPPPTARLPSPLCSAGANPGQVAPGPGGVRRT